MESSKHGRRKLSKEEMLSLLAKWKLEDDALDARDPYAPSPASTRRTFLFRCRSQASYSRKCSSCYRRSSASSWGGRSVGLRRPATKSAGPVDPKTKGFGGEIGSTTATDAFGGRSCEGKTAAPATKRAGPRAEAREFRWTPRTATEIFDEFFGHSSNEKTAAPATKSAGPADPNAKIKD